MMPSCSSSKGTHNLPAAVESLNLIEMHEHVPFAEQRMSLFQDDRESRQQLIDDFAEQIRVTLWVLKDALIDDFSFKALYLGPSMPSHFRITSYTIAEKVAATFRRSEGSKK